VATPLLLERRRRWLGQLRIDLARSRENADQQGERWRIEEIDRRKRTVLAGGELRFRPEAGGVGALKWPVVSGVGRW